ncbi:hypothetical protein [Flavobacterium sp.]|uniref:hypothetical protein n=1 Tax=Flavobacterium sp. TaxID=239 RepID=UPI0025BF630B|nr:hypothetical protein [Flavobacterium sp.]MBA4155122.1 hypothetical protein [Flavobacterium sp.]
MAQSIKVLKSSIIILFILNSCSIHDKNNLKNNEKYTNIVFSSVYDDEKIFLMINDSVFFKNKQIITDRSLGLDRKNFISIKSDTIFLKAIAMGSLNVIDKPHYREIKLDTILYRKKGSYIWLEIRDSIIKVNQQKNKFVLE